MIVMTCPKCGTAVYVHSGLPPPSITAARAREIAESVAGGTGWVAEACYSAIEEALREAGVEVTP